MSLLTNDETKRVSIKGNDRDTDKVIREIPPEKTEELAEKCGACGHSL